MKNIITNVSNLFVGVGLSVYAGTFLFGAGALSVLGWIIMIPLFLGALGVVGMAIYGFIGSKEEREARKVRKEAKKAEAELDKKKAANK